MLQPSARRGKRAGKVEKCSTWNMTDMYVHEDMRAPHYIDGHPNTPGERSCEGSFRLRRLTHRILAPACGDNCAFDQGKG